MLRVVSKERIYFIGKIDEIIESLDDLSQKYTTLTEAINSILNN